MQNPRVMEAPLEPVIQLTDAPQHDIDALSAFLGDRPYLVADRPVVADLAVFGQLAPMMVWPMETPVAQYLRTVPNVARPSQGFIPAENLITKCRD